jgi:hypothetical protein
MNIFADKRAIIGTFKSAGSTDPDVVHATKQSLIGATKPVVIGSWVFTVVGTAATLTIVGALVGVPLIVGCWWLRRRVRAYVADVEAAYREHTAP